MKKIISKMTLAAALIAALSIFAAQPSDNLMYDSQNTLSQFLSTDPGLKTFVDRSAGYAVFPGVGKGGLIVGGARGRGIVYEHGNVVGEATMTQASIGAQAGGQSYDEILFFQTPEALEDFKSGNFKLRGDVSAVVANQGASKAAKYANGIAVFTMPRKGLMVQAAVGGQKFKFVPVRQGARVH